MAAPTRTNHATTTASGTGACTIDISAVPVGAWIIVVLTTDTTGISAIPTTPSGSWRNFLGSNFQQATGSRRTGIVGRIKQSGENSIVWSSTGSSFKRMTAFWGEGTRAAADWTFGTIGVRNAADAVGGQSTQAGTSTTCVAPSVTVAEADSTVLSLFIEATTSTGAASITAGGATLWFNEGDITTYIEQHTVAYIEGPSTGATSAVTATYSQTQASNGLGVQIILPPASSSQAASGTVTATSDSSATATVGRAVSGETPIVCTVSATATTPFASGTVVAQSSVTATATSRQGASGVVPVVSVVTAEPTTIPLGFTSVAQFLSTPGATSAWRLGGGPWPQHSMYAADHSVDIGYGALEFSLGWNSDYATVGPFGLGPQYLDSIVGGSGNIDPNSMTFATMQATYQNRNNPVSPGVYQPFLLLTDLIAKYAATHLLIIDPKYGFDTSAKVTKMLDILDDNGGPTKFLLKFDSPANSCQLTTQGHARGYTVMNYWGTDTASLASQQSNWDIIGMSYLASSGTWTTAKSYGKKIWAAVVPDQSAYDTAWANAGGFDFANVSGVTSVTPVSIDYYSTGTVPVVSTVTGAATSNLSAAGTATGSSAASAAATVGRAVTGTIPATSTVTGTVASRQFATGTVNVTSTVSATATIGVAASGVVTVTSITTAAPTAQYASGGIVAVVSTVSATSGSNPASGTVPITSTVSGTAKMVAPSAGAVIATSAVTATATVGHAATGILEAASSASATALARLVASGIVLIVSTVAATSTTPGGVVTFLGDTPVELRLGDNLITFG